MAERPDWNSASWWNGYAERLWKMRSWAGSVVGGPFGAGRMLWNGSARGLRVEGLEDAAMG